MSRGTLYIMSGPSGTGKGTICNELLKIKDMYLSISATTREPRTGETEGVTYNYITGDEFEKLIENGEMLEYAKYGSSYYGTPKKKIEETLASGRDVMLEIEPQGALKVKKIYPEAVMMFIVPPSMAELKRRLLERARENEAQIKERMEHAAWEFSQAVCYDKVFVNDNLGNCVAEICDYMQQKSAQRGFVNKLLNENY